MSESDMENRPKLLIVTANEFTFRGFVAPWYQNLDRDFEVKIVGHFGKNVVSISEEFNLFEFVNLNFSRKIAILRDLICLIQLILVIKRTSPDYVYSMMPKTGLLGQCAGLLSGVPTRMHIFTGQVWENHTGLKRTFFKKIDQVIASATTVCATDSQSQVELLVKEGIVGSSHDISLFHKGSICGVSENAFVPDCLTTKHYCSKGPFKILFMARVTRDKGIFDLVNAITQLREGGLDVELTICGPDEDGIISGGKIIDVDFRYLEYTKNPKDLFQYCDVICLPSYREGLPMTIVQALAAGAIAAVSDTPGCIDILEPSSDFVFKKGNVEDLVSCLRKIHSMDGESMGKIKQGQIAYIRSKYDSTKVYQGFYELLVEKAYEC